MRIALYIIILFFIKSTFANEITIIELHNKSIDQVLIENFESSVENISLSSSEFRLILIGKDGGIKLNSRKISLEEIFSLIDTMPMRQEEMLNDKC